MYVRGHIYKCSRLFPFQPSNDIIYITPPVVYTYWRFRLRGWQPLQQPPLEAVLAVTGRECAVSTRGDRTGVH